MSLKVAVLKGHDYDYRETVHVCLRGRGGPTGL